MSEDSGFDPFGNRRFAQIEADIAAFKEDIAGFNTKLAAILSAVNAPAWLTPAVPATPVPAPAAAEIATASAYYPPVVDVGGQIYSFLNQIIGILATINTALATIASGSAASEALAQALAGITAAGAALAAAVNAHNAP